jgi:hypothetical protein
MGALIGGIVIGAASGVIDRGYEVTGAMIGSLAGFGVAVFPLKRKYPVPRE